MRRALAILAGLLTLLASAAPASIAAAPKTSLPEVENEVMCPSCREPLALAQSPQAIAERSFISTLVARGYTKQQIEQALVAQYGTAVMAKPPARGFNLTVYVLPPALLVLALAGLAVALPRWRRRARDRASEEPGAPRLSDTDAQRLEQDLAQFRG